MGRNFSKDGVSISGGQTLIDLDGNDSFIVDQYTDNQETPAEGYSVRPTGGSAGQKFRVFFDKGSLLESGILFDGNLMFKDTPPTLAQAAQKSFYIEAEVLHVGDNNEPICWVTSWCDNAPWLVAWTNS